MSYGLFWSISMRLYFEIHLSFYIRTYSGGSQRTMLSWLFANMILSWNSSLCRKWAIEGNRLLKPIYWHNTMLYFKILPLEQYVYRESKNQDAIYVKIALHMHPNVPKRSSSLYFSSKEWLYKPACEVLFVDFTVAHEKVPQNIPRRSRLLSNTPQA